MRIRKQRKIELLKMDRAGIAVAEYWTQLPPKAQFEAKIKALVLEARERIKRHRLLPKDTINKDVDYFIEKKDEV